MTIPFYKYQGTGNDFVLIDQRTEQHLTRKDTDQIKRICDRRFGIGADGLILLEEHDDFDFEMIYFNADGRTSSMCGNGGRCIVALAAKLGIFDGTCTFMAIDGLHEAKILSDGQVSLKMNDVHEVGKYGSDYVLDTGSPHYVHFSDRMNELDMVTAGRSIRYSDSFKEEGINVNYVHQQDRDLTVRTYERGVEDETYACGTGVVAAAIASAEREVQGGSMTFEIQTKGGRMKVRFDKDNKKYSDIWLTGPATLVYQGVYPQEDLQ